jgi:uncharacterized protein YsxB (DUF464 family)
MIKTVFKKSDDEFRELLVTGHANYDKKGKDIVCAAVSTAIIMTVNMISEFKLDQEIDLTIKEGYFKLIVKNQNENIKKILNNLEYSLVDLEKQYPIYIKIKKEG